MIPKPVSERAREARDAIRRKIYSAAKHAHDADRWGVTQGARNQMVNPDETGDWASVRDELDEDIAAIIESAISSSVSEALEEREGEIRADERDRCIKAMCPMCASGEESRWLNVGNAPAPWHFKVRPEYKNDIGVPSGDIVPCRAWPLRKPDPLPVEGAGK